MDSAGILETFELQEIAAVIMPPLPLLLLPLPSPLLLKPLLALLFSDAPQGGGLSGFLFPISKGQWCQRLLPLLSQLPLWLRLLLPPPHCLRLMITSPW